MNNTKYFGYIWEKVIMPNAVQDRLTYPIGIDAPRIARDSVSYRLLVNLQHSLIEYYEFWFSNFDVIYLKSLKYDLFLAYKGQPQIVVIFLRCYLPCS